MAPVQPAARLPATSSRSVARVAAPAASAGGDWEEF
jgi:hypothetical protein